MSFDLYFYKKKGSSVSKESITASLDKRIPREFENSRERFYNNPDTEVYFSFELTKPDYGDNNLEEAFQDFDDTHLSFNLNFMRPDFFGLEAFKFVQDFITELDLYVLNPQGNAGIPEKDTDTSLFLSWSAGNKWSSRDYFKEVGAYFIDPTKANRVWHYNYNRNQLQNELGEEYFVPKIFFLRMKENNQVITLSSWVQHIPTIIPPADYFMLGKEYRSWFKLVKEFVPVDYTTLINTFDGDLEEYPFDGCKIIHPHISKKIGKKFNRMSSPILQDDLGEMIPMEKLFNYQPEH